MRKCRNKFTAAEKHFFKKQAKYEKRIKQLEATTLELTALKNNLLQENKKIKDVNASLSERIGKLLELLDCPGISEDDIKVMCEKDKKIVGLFDIYGCVLK